MNSPLANGRRAKTPSPFAPASATSMSVITGRALGRRLVRGFPREGHVRDERAVRLEGPGRVVGEVTGRSRKAAKYHRRSHHGLLAHDTHEGRRHSDQLLRTLAP